jgi:hypothetical protein
VFTHWRGLFVSLALGALGSGCSERALELPLEARDLGASLGRDQSVSADDLAQPQPGTLDLAPPAPDAVAPASHDLGLTTLCHGDGGALLWAKRFGDRGSINYAAEVVATANDQILLAGVYSQHISFGGPTLTDISFGDFLVRLDGAGGHVWTRATGSSAVDFHGDVIAYEAAGAADAGVPDSGANSTVVVRRNSTGDVVWHHRLDGILQAELTVDAGGAVLLAGMLNPGVADLGSGPITVPGAHGAFFVAKLDPTGSLAWSYSYPLGSGGAPVRGVASDDAGDLFVVGQITAPTGIGDGVALSNSASFLAKYDALGRLAWTRVYDQSGFMRVAARATGEVVISGSRTLQGGGRELIIQKLSAQGDRVWMRSFLSEGSRSDGLAMDAQGNVVWTGDVAGDIDLYGGVMTGSSTGRATQAVVKLDAAGNHRWSKRFDFDSSGNVFAWGARQAAIDAAGEVYVTGRAYLAANVCGTIIPQKLGLDGMAVDSVVLLKFAP